MKKIHHTLIVYTVILYAIWALWEFRIKDLIGTVITNECLSQFVKSGLIKNLVWTLPALLLARRFEASLCVDPCEMFQLSARQLRPALPLFALFTVYLLAGSLLQRGRLAISETFQSANLITVLFVGVTEETVFRGWLLNASLGAQHPHRPDARRRWLLILCNALLFLCIHFPVWLHSGQFAANFRNLGFLGLLVLSLIFSWTFVKTRSLWVPILLHMYWDLLMFLLY